MATRFLVVVFCIDCTDHDDYGCNDGYPWTLGPFDCRQEADAAGRKAVAGVGPWDYEIEETT